MYQREADAIIGCPRHVADVAAGGVEEIDWSEVLGGLFENLKWK